METVENNNNLNEKTSKRNKSLTNPYKPTPAFVGASWTALLAGTVGYCVGLWNAAMQLNEKGFYGMSFALSVFSAIAVQKNTRDAKLAESK